MSALLSGMAMGFAVAMPVGPIGVLCIRRSLSDGRAAGLATGLIAGLGTASASGPYVLVAGVFMGSLLWWLILVLGVGVVKSRLPMRALRWLDLGSGVVLVLWGAAIFARAVSA